MSLLNLALALPAPFAEVSLTSGEVPGSFGFEPLPNTEVEQTQSTNTSMSGNAKSFLVISSPKRVFLAVCLITTPNLAWTARKFRQVKRRRCTDNASALAQSLRSVNLTID
jgi:hypothetical protein